MITVIIPSFNRAHLLQEIIPTYLQSGVTEILLIDDASTDNTSLVMEILCSEINILKYIRLDVNSKQVFAKNIGIENAQNEWIYFGDDDSILMPGSIDALLDTCLSHNADICGAKALYMQTNEDSNDIEQFVNRLDIYTTNEKSIVDLENLDANFTLSSKKPIEVPFTHAGALVRRELAEKIKFDVNYVGNCYREETDFFVRASLKGAKIMYNSKAVQINLPRKVAKGGSHSAGKLRWYYYTVINNHYFMKKNWLLIRKKYNIKRSSFFVELRFIFKLIGSAIKNVSARI